MRRRGQRWTVMACAALFALCACGGGGGFVRPAPGSIADLGTFAEAAVVFGQPVFAFSDANQGAPLPGANTLASPGMPAVRPLFLPDADNHRVLGFAQTPPLSNLDANFVLGQPDFQFAIPGLGATAMHAPTAAVVGGGRLVVSDTGNHRVLVFAGVPDSKGAAAVAALGQPDLRTAVPGGGARGLRGPAGVAVAGTRLVVVDRGNHRVLVWNQLPVASGTPADLVLGQADLDGVSPNRGADTGRHTLLDPCGVWSDGTRLAVADRGNHRVLLWTRFPTASGQPADLVLGQPDGTSRTPGGGPLGMFQPYDVAGDGGSLFVADAGNHRVLAWYGLPDADGALPHQVLGQADFEGRTPNDDDQDGLEDPTPSGRTLRSKDGVLTVAVDGPTLFVGDAGNHRLLVFQGR